MANRAVLFDFDGVIADTENVHIAAWERTFTLLGWEVEPEVCARAAEQDDFAFLAEVFLERGIDDGDVAGWISRKQGITKELLSTSPRLYPGVRELVEALRGKAQLAVVSGTWRENVATVLGATGLDGAFSLILGKEDAQRPKPDPEVYKLALKTLGVKPSSAVAIEDSPIGMKSAMEAGIPVVAVGHRRPTDEWAAGAFFVPNLLPLVSLGSWFS